MRPAVAALVLVAVAVSIALLPRADVARVAALECHELLQREIADSAPPQRIGDAVLDGPAVDRVSAREAKLHLYGVRFVAASSPSDDPTIHDLARRSLIRGLRELAAERDISLSINGEWMPTPSGAARGASFLVTLDGSKLALVYEHPDGAHLAVESNDFAPAGRLSLLPPLIAIALAIVLRRPVSALLAGIASAAFLLRWHAGSGVGGALAWALPDVATRMLWPQLVDGTQAQIIGFTLAMFATVGVITQSGGMRGIVDAVARRATGPRSAQVATWCVGVLVFFDDYASCILTGSTMRRVTDAYRVSREKLAYLVDSTAAPIASFAVFTSWIAFQVSTYAPQLPAAKSSASQGYAVFVEALPYRFYCVFTVLLAVIVALSGRDFGPMLAAERRARATGKLQRDGARPLASDDASHLEMAGKVAPRAHRAILPVLVFMLVTPLEVARVGFARVAALEPGARLVDSLTSLDGLTELLAKGDTVRAMWFGSLAALASAAALALAAGLRREIARSAWSMVRATFSGIAIVYCAWMISAACGELGTATYLTELLGDKLAPQLFPALLFLVACGVSFATGTSWGTMGMLLPLVVGLAFTFGERIPLGGHAMVVVSIAAVLEGAVFGDHCSPLASTSILASISSAADLIDHVRTQLPYGLLALALTVCAGYFPCTFLGWSPWLSLAVGAAALLMTVLVFGRRIAQPDLAREA